MKEEDRLAAVVACIDHEVAVVPHGAYIKTPLGGVRQNRSFDGMNDYDDDNHIGKSLTVLMFPLKA